MDANMKEIFAQVGWRLPKKAEIENLCELAKVDLSEDFRRIYPIFSSLVDSAQITQFTVNELEYRLYSWSDADGDSFGWLADLSVEPKKISSTVDSEEHPVTVNDLIPEHLLFLNNVGGIFETWNMPDDESFLTWAKNFVFSFSDSYRYVCQDAIYGEDAWIQDVVSKEMQLPMADLVCFSEEANGNLTFYNKNDKKVYLLLGDHSFDYVEELEGHPEYSFYTIKGVNDFVEYVELLASQILSNIK